MLKRYILSKMTLLYIFQNWEIKIVMLGWYVCCTQLAMLPQTIQEIAPIWLHLQWQKHGNIQEAPVTMCLLAILFNMLC